jgi:hypothetical protein
LGPDTLLQQWPANLAFLENQQMAQTEKAVDKTLLTTKKSVLEVRKLEFEQAEEYDAAQ